ncbi:MAG: PAS domain-containing protein [Promethearchaeota archaeon]
MFNPDWGKILENTSIIFIRWRNQPGTPIEFVSKNIEIFGYTPEDLIEKIGYESLIHPEDLGNSITRRNIVLQDKTEIYEQQYRLRTNSGEYRWINDRTWIIWDENGNFIGTEGILTDISSLKEREHELELSEELLRIIAENTSDVIFEFNLEDRTFNWIGRIWNLLECLPSKSPLTDNDLKKFIHPNDLRQYEQFFSLHFDETKRKRGIRCRIKLTSGKIGFWTFNGKLTIQGEKRLLIGSIDDKSLEMMYQQETELRKSMDYIGNLTRGVFHDLNNVLSILMGNFTILNMEQSSLTQDQQQIINTIVQACERAENEVKTIQHFSNFEQGPRKIIDLYEVTKDIVSFLNNNTDKQIIKESSIIQKQFYMDINPSELNQVFLNLATNSFQSLEQKGPQQTPLIRISASHVVLSDDFIDNNLSKNRIYTGIFNALDGQNYVHIQFEDSGIGLEGEQLYSLFEPSLSASMGAGGNKSKGLGLAICFNIINIKNNGFIQVRSDYGQGTCFHIFLPEVLHPKEG